MRISITNAKRRLTIVWFTGAGILFALVLLQTIFGKYLDRSGEAWAWLLPTFMPTLSLMLGVLVADSLSKVETKNSEETADQFVFRLSFFLSIAYLAVVILTILLGPFFEQSSKKPLLDLMKLSNLWLAPFQGLVSASLGAFFVSKK